MITGIEEFNRIVIEELNKPVSEGLTNDEDNMSMINKLLSDMTKDELLLAYYYQVELRAAENKAEMLQIIKDDIKTVKRLIKTKK